MASKAFASSFPDKSVVLPSTPGVPIAGMVSLLSGLTFGLFDGLPNTSLNLLAGDFPRSLLILSLRESALKVSARSTKPLNGDEAG